MHIFDDYSTRIFESLLANSQIRLQSIFLAKPGGDFIKNTEEMKEKFSCLTEDKIDPLKEPHLWYDYFEPPLCDEREMSYLQPTMEENGWDDYHNKMFIFLEKQLFLDDMFLRRVPFTFECVQRG